MIFWLSTESMYVMYQDEADSVLDSHECLQNNAVYLAPLYF